VCDTLCVRVCCVSVCIGCGSRTRLCAQSVGGKVSEMNSGEGGVAHTLKLCRASL